MGFAGGLSCEKSAGGGRVPELATDARIYIVRRIYAAPQ
jgi:hypothetical protein